MDHVEVDDDTGCLVWTGALTNGYGTLKTGSRTDGTRRREYARRVAYREFVGPIRGLFVLDDCDNRRCINPMHLFLGTTTDNNANRDAKGRNNQPRGEDHGKAKLTEADVIELRKLYAEGRMRCSEQAHRFGVRPSTIMNAVLEKTWKRLRSQTA